MEPVIIVEDLVKRYGRIAALKGLSFKVYRGEIYGLLGPNGAGKTTTIRAVAGALKPTRGRVLVLGMDSWRMDFEVRKHIGIVPELPSLYNELTVRDNLYYIARIRGLSKNKTGERIKSVAEALALKEFLDRRYGKLSKGLKRRADIAAAIIHDPEILLLDEPTSGVDPLRASSIRELVKRLARTGKTIILSSHYIDEAMNLSNRVLFLYKGTRVIEGEPSYLARILGLGKEVRIYTAEPLSDEEAGRIRELIESSAYASKIRVEGEVIVAVTRETVEFLEEVLPRIKELGVKVRDLEILPPSWEMVFKGYIQPLEEGGCGPCPLTGTGV